MKCISRSDSAGPRTRAALLGLFRINQFNDVYSVLEAIDHGRIADIRDHLYDDSIDEMFAPLTMRLLQNSPWNLYVKTSAFDEFQSGKTNRFDVHGLLDPRVLFEGFAAVKVMAANIHDTLMVKYWKAIGQSTIKAQRQNPRQCRPSPDHQVSAGAQVEQAIARHDRRRGRGHLGRQHV